MHQNHVTSREQRWPTNHATSWFRLPAVIGLVLALAMTASTLVFGGVTALGFAPVQMAVAVLAMAVFWRRGFPRLSRATAAVVVTLCVAPLVQWIRLPRFVVGILSPARLDLADRLSVLGAGLPQTLALTVNSYETRLALLRLICYLLVFLLAMRAYQLSGDQPILLALLIGLGVFEASYGIIQYLTGWQYIFFFQKQFDTEEATGTYINRNHYAGLLEMVIPFVLARVLIGPSSRPHGMPLWRRLLTSSRSSRVLRDAVVLVVLVVGLLFSRSRMGIAAAVLGMVLAAVLAHRQGYRSVGIGLLLVLLLAGAYASWIGLSPVVERFAHTQQQGIFEENRIPVWRDTVALIRDYPVFGTGLGTYTWSSLHYQSDLLSVRYDHAHNDYLELAADLGVPAAVVFWAGLWILLGKVSRKALRLHRSHDQILAVGCAGALLALSLHSLTDFNLQIPSNAFLFSWIAGTAAGIVQKGAGSGPGSFPVSK